VPGTDAWQGAAPRPAHRGQRAPAVAVPRTKSPGRIRHRLVRV